MGETDGTTENLNASTLRSELKNVRGVVSAYEWGPSLDKLIIEFTGRVSGRIDAKTFSKVGASKKGEKREVKDAYPCDPDGNRTDQKTFFVAVELGVGYKKYSAYGAAFKYSMFTGCNTWMKSFTISLELAPDSDLHVGLMKLEGKIKGKILVPQDIVIPEVEVFDTDSYTYRGMVASIGEEREIKLNRAFYDPRVVRRTSEDGTASTTRRWTGSTKRRLPLIIWLHGAGESSGLRDDINIALLGNEVTALTKEKIQSYFDGGACVLALQCRTMWMDRDGNKTYNHKGSRIQTSYYTEAVMAAIKDTVESHPEVDRRRIYLTGCSNGGYMVMNLMYEYGDYFAAYVPVCESFLDINVTDEMIERTKDNSVWFIQAEDDPTVKVKYTAVPTFFRYIMAGATDTHFTLLENVRGLDAPGAKYYGHWSWVYFFKDAAPLHNEFDNDALKAAGKQEYVTHINCVKPANMWKWLAKQSRKG